MPTTRRRHVITETDEISRALEYAAVRWPEDGARPARLLARLVVSGTRELRDGKERLAESRRTAIKESCGSMTGAYEDGYLERLREDWPE